jgi:hypothetical protein
VSLGQEVVASVERNQGILLNNNPHPLMVQNKLQLCGFIVSFMPAARPVLGIFSRLVSHNPAVARFFNTKATILRPAFIW